MLVFFSTIPMSTHLDECSLRYAMAAVATVFSTIPTEARNDQRLNLAERLPHKDTGELTGLQGTRFFCTVPTQSVERPGFWR